MLARSPDLTAGGTAGPWPTPLSAPSRVAESGPGRIITITPIGADEECFAGHYPGFPLLPGVLLIETVHRAVRRYAADRLDRAVRLGALRRVSFSGPVFPGDKLTTECGLTLDGDRLTVVARCHTATTQAGRVRAEYATWSR